MLLSYGIFTTPTAIIFVLAAITVIYLLLKELTSSLRGVPGPVFARVSNFYLISNAFKSNMHVLFSQLHTNYGDLVRYGPNKISVADPALLPLIYGVGSKYYKAPFFDSFAAEHEGSILDNVFATRDLAWHKNMKSAVAPAYSLSYLRQFEPRVDECSKVFVDAMYDLAGTTVDLGEWLQWYAFDVIGNITFSKTFGMLKDRCDRRKVIEGLGQGDKYATIVAQLPGLHSYLLGNGKLVELTNRVPALAEANPVLVLNEMVREAMQSNTVKDVDTSQDSSKNYLQYLRRVQSEKPGRLSDRDVWSALLVNMFAGSDTTAMSLRAIFYYLVQNPACYLRLQREIDQADQDGKLSDYVEFEQGLNLPYLQAVIKEAMRLHPGVGYPLERIVPEGGAEMCGHILPQGTIVGMHPWVIHRNRSIFGEDAESFRPERWLEEDVEKIKLMNQNIMTFGAGSRICLGKNVSALEMSKFVPQVMRHFDFAWAEKGSDWSIAGFWFAKQSGLIMRLTARRHKAVAGFHSQSPAVSSQ